MNDRAILVAAVSVGSMVAVATGMVGQRCWPGPAGDLRQVAAEYQSLHKMNEEPVGISVRLSRLCRYIPIEELREIEEGYGPHAGAAINVYMNEGARRAYESETEYPIGAVIIKEKIGLDWTIAEGESEWGGETALGGMIKRTPGYDRPFGDWEYFYVGHGQPWMSGRLTNCIQCHDIARERDHVFGGWGH